MSSGGTGWGSVAELEAATAAYQKHWWRDDPDIAALCAATSGLGATLAGLSLVTTDQVHREPSGAWRAPRVAVHDALARQHVADGTPLDDPVAYFTIGPMGSGKTTALRSLVQAHREARGRSPADARSTVAADEIRMALPEYAGGLGSLVVHAECLEVAYTRVFPDALVARQDMIFDTIGTIRSAGQISIEPSLVRLRDEGFEIHLVLADAPLDLCIERALRRALEVDGRLVDPAAQAHTHPQPRQVLDVLVAAGWPSGWAVVDTSSTGPRPPITDGTDDWTSLS